MVRIGIDSAIDHAGDAGLDQGVCAGSGATVGRTRFERHVSGGTADIDARCLCRLQCGDLRMRPTGLAMVTLRDDFAVLDKDRTDSGIRGGEPKAQLGLGERKAHEIFVSGNGHEAFLNDETGMSNRE